MTNLVLFTRYLQRALAVLALGSCLVGCGGDGTTLTFPVTFGGCKACTTDAVFAVYVLREVNDSACIYQSSKTSSSSLKLEGLQLEDGEKVEIVVEKSCADKPTEVCRGCDEHTIGQEAKGLALPGFLCPDPASLAKCPDLS